ncbi:MAG: PAS domain-containing protein, partial [Elusimicrobia bacterium]|nr:PAS domain-containing protein [Elusimicrobiota bacterium]
FVEDALLPPSPWDEIISTVLSIALVLWLISRFLRQLRGVEDERDATTAALVRREERLEGVVDNLSAAVFLKDMEGRFLLINKEFERVFGVKRRDVIGRTAGDSLPKAVAETLEPISREVMESKAARRTERTLVGADGASRSYLCVQFPVPDPEGDIHALGGIATDITTDK